MKTLPWSLMLAAPLLLVGPFSCGNKSSADHTVGTGGSDPGDDGNGGEGDDTKTDLYCTIAGAPCGPSTECCGEMVCKKRCCSDVGGACRTNKNECCEGTKCDRGICKQFVVGNDGGACIQAFDSTRKCETARECCKPLGSCVDHVCCSQAGEGCNQAEDCCSPSDCDLETRTCVPKTATDGAGGGATDGAGGSPACAGLRQPCADRKCCDRRLDCDEDRAECCIGLSNYYKMCSSAADCCGASSECSTMGLCCSPTGQPCDRPGDCCSDTDSCIDNTCGQCISDGEECSETAPCCTACNEYNTCGDPY